jgi:hypothetical protein
MSGPRQRVFDIRFGERREPFEVSVRVAPYGGGVRQAPVERPVGLFQSAHKLLLLIHGYNVTLCSAGCAYEQFRKLLSVYWNARAVCVYWPGDAETPSFGSRWLRFF